MNRVLANIFIKGKIGDQIENFPLTIRGREIHNVPCTEDCSKRISEGDILMTLSDISIIRDQYSLAVKVQQKRKKKLVRFGDYGYILQFKYLPESQTYALHWFQKGLND